MMDNPTYLHRTTSDEEVTGGLDCGQTGLLRKSSWEHFSPSPDILYTDQGGNHKNQQSTVKGC